MVRLRDEALGYILFAVSVVLIVKMKFSSPLIGLCDYVFVRRLQRHQLTTDIARKMNEMVTRRRKVVEDLEKNS